MNKGLVALYRISGILVSLYAYISLFGCLRAFFAGAPGPMIIVIFVAACLVIYSVLSTMFGRTVLILQQPMRASLKDWIKVNAYVSLAVYACIFLICLIFVSSPAAIEAAVKQHPEALQVAGTPITMIQFWAFIKGALILSLLISAHCIWSLRLVRKFRAFFK